MSVHLFSQSSRSARDSTFAPPLERWQASRHALWLASHAKTIADLSGLSSLSAASAAPARITAKAAMAGRNPRDMAVPPSYPPPQRGYPRVAPPESGRRIIQDDDAGAREAGMREEGREGDRLPRRRH